MPDKKDNEALKRDIEEALLKFAEIHPRLPNLLTAISVRQEGIIKAVGLLEQKVVAHEERMARFEEMGGVAILKLARETKRVVCKEEREEKKLERKMKKAAEKAAK